MRQSNYSDQFQRDVKQSQKQGKAIELKTLLGLLIEGEPLPASYLNPPLKGS
jgi:mRNA interferase YafQ